jgi:hypothetical protein
MESVQPKLYCEGSPVHEARYRPDSEPSPVAAVANAVAALEGIDPVELPPLYDQVDVEAVNRLMEPSGADVWEESTVCFTVRNWNVVVRGDGQIVIFDGDETGEPTPVFDTDAGRYGEGGHEQQPTTVD